MRRLLSFAIILFLFSASRKSAAQTDLYDTPPGSGCWMQASDGNLYEQGYMFNLTTLAAPTAFPLPSCSFFQGTDTNFYTWSDNVVTKVTLAGVASTVHALTEAEGYEVAAILQGKDGNFYGVAGAGGAYGYGTLFTFTPGGSFTTLYSFTNGPDGEYPENLVQASDGNLYGTTSGTTFSATLTGQVATIANVGGANALIEGSTGSLYGLYGSDFNAVSLNGQVTLIATYLTLGLQDPIEPPCFLDGAGNFDCSSVIVDDDNNDDTLLLSITPSGSYGSFGYQFSAGGWGYGYAYATYSLSGEGTYFGDYSGEANCGDECQPTFSYLYDGIEAPAPIQISITPAVSAPGQAVMLTWQVNNAFSDTMALCFASGAWSGIKATSGTANLIAPNMPGTYRYALTCGGTETAAATISVGASVITVGASPTTIVTGSAVTLTATVTGTTSGTPTGKVTFMDGNLVIGSALLNGSGVAVLTAPTKGVPAGTYNVTATYAGSASYAPSTSSPVAVTILAQKASSSVVLAASPMPVKAGETLTLTATVYGGSSGSVTFYSGNLRLGTAALTTNPVTLSLQTAGVPAGTYPIFAVYSGDALALPSTSNSIKETVITSNTPTVTLAASPNPVTPPAQVTLICTVNGVSGQPAPTGTVYFYLGSTYLGADSLNGNGVASFSTSTSGDPAGTYAVSATYLGDSNYINASATSSVTLQ